VTDATRLIADVDALLNGAPEVAVVLGLATLDLVSFPALVGALLGNIASNHALGDVVRRVYTDNLLLVTQTEYDVAETARRNFEPGGPAATLLFARGVHAIMAHRVAHQLWHDGDHNLALAVKSTFGRFFATDIHPAAKLGAGLWLDHGLGFVVGETAVIAEDVSIWHGVTLGSTLTDSGSTRHPRIERGAVIGAGAILLGGITIGAGANIAAGAIVLEDVAEHTTYVGTKARCIGPAKVSFFPELGEPS
jgi:serine O-acetyltransferase